MQNGRGKCQDLNFIVYFNMQTPSPTLQNVSEDLFIGLAFLFVQLIQSKSRSMRSSGNGKKQEMVSVHCSLRYNEHYNAILSRVLI